MVKHCADHDHKVCDCGGYHYKHRPGSPCCKVNPMSPVHTALREGATSQEARDIEDDVLWFGRGKPMNDWRQP